MEKKKSRLSEFEKSLVVKAIEDGIADRRGGAPKMVRVGGRWCVVVRDIAATATTRWHGRLVHDVDMDGKVWWEGTEQVAPLRRAVVQKLAALVGV